MTKIKLLVILILPLILLLGISFGPDQSPYINFYKTKLNDLKLGQKSLISLIENKMEISPKDIFLYKSIIDSLRLKLKAIDFWIRYIEPASYHKVNGPLPVEWETEVFEKYEKPYKRNGAGLTLAELYLNEPGPKKDSLLKLLYESDYALQIFMSDSVTLVLNKPDHFFFANRLFLLNLASIYTTGFECPDSHRIIPELNNMLAQVYMIYNVFNSSNKSYRVTEKYLRLYNALETFVVLQNKEPENFDHYRFIRNYINPLFILNQEMIQNYKVMSNSYNDYSLNNNCNSIFDKNLYYGQNRKGIFIAINDTSELNEIKEIGKLLFFDPILSGNGKRSCASCHKPTAYFTDTTEITSLEFNETGRLTRNTPTLINVIYNHLLMLDGKHISLQNQAKDVITNPKEMGCNEHDVLNQVMSCAIYKKAFQKFRKLTPNYPEVNLDHIVSAVTLYYSGFSDFYSPFDSAMNNQQSISNECINGFNLFMSKAQCATCHFVPQFNGVKPPFISSEFEVLGVPSDTSFKNLSSDSGRYKVNPAFQTMHAFRTGSIRNSALTKPYMHNGVFNSIDDVIDFYNSGGGAGRGLQVDNQTLSSDSLHLTITEKKALKAFICALNENIIFPSPPKMLPATKMKDFKNRKVGGEY